MPASVVGREAELTALNEFLARLPGGSAALVLEGEAGMGKTTLWRAAVEHARTLGVTALQAQPVESETTLSYAGIGDLLDPVLDVALEPLPAVQRRALSSALMLDDEDGRPLDPRALRVALMNALRALAEERPVLVAIDDSQWLDFASSAGLAYGFRRFRVEPIGLLLSRRSGLESVLLDELLRSPAGERFTRVHVGSLDVHALGGVLHEQLGMSLPRPLLAEVHAAAGGNPFYALEIVRMLQRSGASIEAGQPMPLPESLHDLVHGRVLALPSESRDFLLAAAAHAHPTIEITEAASGVARSDGLEPALSAKVVELDRTRIRFTHPLLAAGVYEAASPLRRVEVHRRLAELLEDPEARAWQLAASVGEPDDAVAAVLEEAAAHARARGAPRPAALLLERAGELTAADRIDDANRRAIDAAFLHFEAGDSRRAESQLRDLVAPMNRGPERARALVVLARIRLYEAPREARELFLQVVAEAGEDRQTLAFAHEGVAACSVWVFERFEEVLRHAEIALSLAAELGDDSLAADVLMVYLAAETLLGRPSAAATAEQALSLQGSATELRVLDQPLVALAEHWIWVDLHTRARDALGELLRRAHETGDENGRPYLLYLLGEVERAQGDLSAALERALDAQQTAEQSAQPLFLGLGLGLESVVQAQLGRIGETTTAVRRALEISPDSAGGRFAPAALGHVELSLGAPGDAVAHLEPLVAFVRQEGVAEPSAARFVIDQVEALIAVGRGDDAFELLAWYETNARRLGRISALANCLRCRGMLAAYAGELDVALVAYGEALEWHAKVELPLDRGRTLLALGATQRRAKRRREARATLEEALGVFERIGAALWAERARAELKRISGRAATPGALTPAEERVAALVAEGKTNREVAAALFLSGRTVEGHLGRIFAKLGVRHRGEIAAALAARQIQGIAASNTGDSPVSAETVSP
ncbi:MAG TPA: LuxR family transcriptional regulator [Gaiellaceae bacterium]|nr:LuxR family transcriptional regulator [Gaiellaceae bacterium]